VRVPQLAPVDLAVGGGFVVVGGVAVEVAVIEGVDVHVAAG